MGTVTQVHHQSWIVPANSNDDRPMDSDARVVLSTTTHSPGDSGGPLIDDRPELIGVNQGKLPNAMVSIAIDVSEVWTVLRNCYKAHPDLTPPEFLKP
jgi:S1-C subfamily serine protease